MQASTPAIITPGMLLSTPRSACNPPPSNPAISPRRVIDVPLQHALEAAGAVVIEGARATGKTMTAMNAARSFVFMDDPDFKLVVDAAPQMLLGGARPRLLDEWQVAPSLWNLVRRSVDSSANPGQFILTGSSVPSDDLTRHTGAGRFLRLRQRTMSWWEKLEYPSTQIGLADLFDGRRPSPSLANTDLDTVIDNLLRPGFPAMTRLTLPQSAKRLRRYIDDVARTDIPRLAEVRHQPEVVKQLINAIARSAASEVTYATLAEDVRGVAPSIKAETIANYVELLQRLFIVEPQPAWSPSLRSRARLRRAPKLHLADAALTAAAMKAGPDQLRSDLKTLGFLFESAVIHDLTVFATALDGEVFHYRDSNGHEIDAIIALADGRWGAVEVKLGGGRVLDAANSLNTAIKQIDTDAVGDPSFRLVITGTGHTLVTDDGTVTAPLAALSL